MKMSREEFDRHVEALAVAHTEDAFIGAFAPLAEAIFAHESDPGRKMGKLMFALLRGVTEGFWWGDGDRV